MELLQICFAANEAANIDQREVERQALAFYEHMKKAHPSDPAASPGGPMRPG